MISSVAVLSSVLLVATAFPQQVVQVSTAVSEEAAPKAYIMPKILSFEQDRQDDGSFNYGYETENGISMKAAGSLKNAGTKEEAMVVRGSYSFPAPDGKILTITYIADEEGFKPQGDAIPTPPAIPEAIARSIEYLRSLPPQPEEKEQH